MHSTAVVDIVQNKERPVHFFGLGVNFLSHLKPELSQESMCAGVPKPHYSTTSHTLKPKGARTKIGTKQNELAHVFVLSRRLFNPGGST